MYIVRVTNSLTTSVLHGKILDEMSPLISFCFSKKRPLRLFTSFFNSDKESYLQIHNSLPSPKIYSGVCTQANVRIVFARHFWPCCHGRVKCNFFNIAKRPYNKVLPLTWHENYDPQLSFALCYLSVLLEMRALFIRDKHILTCE